MHKVWVILLAAAGLGALGWWGYQSQRIGPRPALEITAGNEASGGGANSRASGATTGVGRDDGKVGGTGATRGTGATSGADTTKGGAGSRRPAGAARSASRPPAAEQMPLADDVFAVGTLRANESVVMKPEIAGRIVDIGFRDGASVRKGAVLVRLDDSVLAAQVEQARAELGLARTNFERTEDLAKRNFVSGSARDQAAATLKVQAARLQLAEAQLAKTRIVAPFTGVLGLRNVSVGDFVKDGAELVTLEDISSMKVDLRLPERYLGQLRKGQEISVVVDAFPQRSFAAKLDALDCADRRERSIPAGARPAGQPGRRPALGNVRQGPDRAEGKARRYGDSRGGDPSGRFGGIRLQARERQGDAHEGRDRNPPQRQGGDPVRRAGRRPGGHRRPAAGSRATAWRCA